MSPTTNTSGWPGRVRSGLDADPPRAVELRPRLLRRPAPPTGSPPRPPPIPFVTASMRSSLPSASLTVMPRLSTPTTGADVLTSIPSRVEALGRPCGPAACRTPATTTGPCVEESDPRVTGVDVAVLAPPGAMRGFAIWPAISTPVGPAPTMTKVISRSTSAGLVLSSASSNAPKIRARSSRASSIDFNPGAKSAKLSLPEYDWVAPAARMRLSYGVVLTSPAVSDVTILLAMSMRVTSPSMTRALR